MLLCFCVKLGSKKVSFLASCFFETATYLSDGKKGRAWGLGEVEIERSSEA